jgi:hypothetical protein
MLVKLVLMLAIALGASAAQARPGALCGGISPTVPVFDDTTGLLPMLPSEGCH